MPNFAVWKTITYRHWHRWCCNRRCYVTPPAEEYEKNMQLNFEL